MPHQLTSFIGREREVAEVKRLLAMARLLTITGTGGAGKTRLALQVASDLLDNYPDGVYFIDLALLPDPSLVPQEIAVVFGISEQQSHLLLETLEDYLASRKVLLLLDNCEHLIQACALVSDRLLRACPRLSIIATSRHILDVAGEITWQVPPLSLPDLNKLPSVEILEQYEAIHLFIERARLRRPNFDLTPENAIHVAQLCNHLDGLPLAIELAARISVLSPEQIVSRLDARFRLLTDGVSASLPRQHTLQAAIDWSYDLLAENEKLLLCRLSVFVGSFSLEAALDICGVNIDEYETIGLISQLVDKSLVNLEERGGTRYRLLETIRQYAWEKTQHAGDVQGLCSRHLHWYLQMAESAQPQLQGSDQMAWLDRLEIEHDNLRAALSRSQELESDKEACLRLAVLLWRFWYRRGYLSEGRRWLELALANAHHAPPSLRARALYRAGLLASDQGDYTQAAMMLSNSLALSRELDDKLGIADCLNSLGVLADYQGDYRQAQVLYEESLALQEDLGLQAKVASCLNNLGYVASMRDEYTRARSLLTISLETFQELENRLEVANVLNNLGRVALFEGKSSTALDLFEESLQIRRKLGDKIGVATSLVGLGELALYECNYSAASSLLQESLALGTALESKVDTAIALHDLGQVERCQGNYINALTLYEDALAISRDIGTKNHTGGLLHNIGQVKCKQGDYKQAAELFSDSLELAAWSGMKRVIAQCLAGLGEVFGAHKEWKQAAQLFGAAEALLTSTGYSLHPVDRAQYDSNIMAARSQLDRGGWTEAWAGGQNLTLDSAIVLVSDARTLSGHSPKPDADIPTDTPEYPAGLTRREVEVLRLVAEGLTNDQVAERLYLSTHTVRAHLHSIYGKLDVANRAGAARFATIHKLVDLDAPG